jgi:cysteinyl-tRNA synthetase
MSEKTLGLPFDIHSGGMDLIFPHHENEIAQTCSAHKKINNPKYFAKYWFHNGFVNVEGEKMSKSIGNIRLVHEMIKEYKGEVLRMTLLSAHYRQPLNWTKGIIKQNSTMLDRLYRTLKDLEHIDAYTNNHALPQNILEGFYDDLNTPKVIAELNILTNKVSKADEEEKSLVKYCLLETGKILGILQQAPREWLGYGQSKNLDEVTIENLIKERNEARRKKNFEMADSIRKKLKESGIEIEDTSNGTTWRSN